MESTVHILVVDDDNSIVEFIKVALEDEGYEVAAAWNGAAALDYVANRRPDLIVLDLRMPIIDGWRFVQTYRSMPPPHAPIIIMTAAVDAVLAVGNIHCDHVLPKPFDLGELLQAVERSTRQSGQAHPASDDIPSHSFES